MLLRKHSEMKDLVPKSNLTYLNDKHRCASQSKQCNGFRNDWHMDKSLNYKWLKRASPVVDDDGFVVSRFQEGEEKNSCLVTKKNLTLTCLWSLEERFVKFSIWFMCVNVYVIFILNSDDNKSLVSILDRILKKIIVISQRGSIRSQSRWIDGRSSISKGITKKEQQQNFNYFPWKSRFLIFYVVRFYAANIISYDENNVNVFSNWITDQHMWHIDEFIMRRGRQKSSVGYFACCDI